jgi:transposase
LVKIEHAFRIAKSDLEARPIYHHKEESIKNHILICFIALTISVYLELKTEKSIASIVEKIKSITDAKILNKITGKILFQRVKNRRKEEELEKMLH